MPREIKRAGSRERKGQQQRQILQKDKRVSIRAEQFRQRNEQCDLRIGEGVIIERDAFGITDEFRVKEMVRVAGHRRIPAVPEILKIVLDGADEFGPKDGPSGHNSAAVRSVNAANTATNIAICWPMVFAVAFMRIDSCEALARACHNFANEVLAAIVSPAIELSPYHRSEIRLKRRARPSTPAAPSK